MTAIIAVAAAILVLDISLNRVNISILYLVLLSFVGLLRKPRHLFLLAAILVGLTMAGYLLKFWIWEGDTSSSVWSYRLVNRSLVSVTLLLMVPIMKMIATVPHSDGRRDDFDGLLSWLLPVVGLAVAGMLLLVVAITDALTSSNINLPILYSVVLLLAMGTHHRKLIWTTFVTAAALALLGLAMNPTEDRLSVVNRLIGILTMLTLATASDFWILREKLLR